MNLQWQYVAENEWALGEVVRGVVRDPVARVYATFRLKERYWFWTAGGKCGEQNTLTAAVAAAEKELGCA